MRMPCRGLGPWVSCALGVLCGCSTGPEEASDVASRAASISSVPPSQMAFAREPSTDEEASGSELIHVVEGRARAMARALELTEDAHAVLLDILLHEADRLDAVREQVSDPLMKEAIEDHRQSVADWKAREIRRSLGPVLAERIGDYELGRAERVAITPGRAGPDR